MDKKPIGAIHSEIGRRIKGRRDEMGFNQTDLGKAAGVSQQQIGKYEDGTNRVKLERLIDIAKALQVQPGYLLDTIAPMIAASVFTDVKQEPYGAMPAIALRRQLNSAVEKIEDVEDLRALARAAEAFGKKEPAR